MFGDNATGRLRTILVGMHGRQDGRPLREAWQAVLGLPDSTNATLLPVIARVVELPDAARAEIVALEDQDTEGLLAWYDHVQTAMSLAHQFETAVENFKRQYKPEDLVTLRHASFQVDKARPDTPLPPEQLPAAVDEVRDLIDVLLASPDLDSTAREMLVQAATGILNALVTYPVTGAEGVRRSLTNAFAVWRLVADEAPSKRSAAVRSFGVVLGHMANLTTVTLGTAQLGPAVEQVIKMIGS